MITYQEEITSLQNPKIKSIVKWRDRPGRDDANTVIIEGYRALTRALAGNYPVNEVFVCPELFQGEHEDELLARLAARGARMILVSRLAFLKIAYRDRPEGLLGIGPQIHQGLDDLPIPEKPALYLVTEQIEKPGNLGTIMRSADATGVNGLILTDPRTDLYNPNVVRASTGNLFTLPIAEATPEEAIAWLKSHHIQILAASPHAKPLCYDCDLTVPTAFVVGAEQYGLTPIWMDNADITVRLPMLGNADSLNVSTSAALLLYEVVRQRIAAGIINDPGAVPESADC